MINAPEITNHFSARVGCHYTWLEGGIHQFVFETGSRQTIDEWTNYADALIVDASPDNIYLQLIDTAGVGDIPVPYGYEKVKQLSAVHPNIIYSRTAFIHAHSSLVFLVNTYMKMLRLPLKARFFNADQRQAAIDWLLEGTP